MDPSSTTPDDETPAEAPRPEDPADQGSSRTLVQWIVVVGGAVVLALVIRMFVMQTFWIPSESMSSTLVEDDRVLVNKLAYRFHDVHRGDVVVFERPPTEPAQGYEDLIKRVVALAGERVSILDGKVRIDGRSLAEPYTHGLPTDLTACAPIHVPGIDTTSGFEVPDGHVFVLGDNRTHSHDGRCFGPVDEDLIVGRAFVLIWPPGRAGGL